MLPSLAAGSVLCQPAKSPHAEGAQPGFYPDLFSHSPVYTTPGTVRAHGPRLILIKPKCLMASLSMLFALQRELGACISQPRPGKRGEGWGGMRSVRRGRGGSVGPSRGFPPCAQGQAVATSAIPQSVCSGLLRVNGALVNALIHTVIYIY